MSCFSLVRGVKALGVGRFDSASAKSVSPYLLHGTSYLPRKSLAAGGMMVVMVVGGGGEGRSEFP